MTDQAIYNEFEKTNGYFDFILPCGNVLLSFNSHEREIKGLRLDKAGAKDKLLETDLQLLKKTFSFQVTYAEALETIMNEYNENPSLFCRF